MRVLLVALMVALCAAVLVQQAVAEEERRRCQYAGGIYIDEDLCFIENPSNDPSQCYMACLAKNLRPPSPQMSMMNFPGYCTCSADDENDHDDEGYDDK